MCTTQQVLSQRFPKVTGAKVVWVLIHSTQNPPDEEEKRESESKIPFCSSLMLEISDADILRLE